MKPHSPALLAVLLGLWLLGPTPQAGQARAETHSFRAGDTLYALARAHQITVAELLKLNPGLDPRRIRPGTAIRIRPEADRTEKPTAGPAPTAEAAGPSRQTATSTSPATATSTSPATATSTSPATATILPGDNLSSIAHRNGTTTSALLAANPGIDPRRLRPGRSISLPPTATTTGGKGKEAEPVPPVSSQARVVVRPGDTPSTVAGQHGVSTAALLAANPGLDPRRLRPGDQLLLPGTPPRAGATAVASATRTPDPSAAGAPAPSGGDEASTAGEAATESDVRIVRIVSGQTLTDIARTHGTSVKALLSDNPQLDPRRIPVGTAIRVLDGGDDDPEGSERDVSAEEGPAPAGATASAGRDSRKPAPSARDAKVTVRRGDTLATIARRNGTTTTALLGANPGVDPRRLRPGARLRLTPAEDHGGKATVRARTTTVNSGDTLSEIAARHGISISRLRQFNNIDGHHIRAGQTLIVDPGAEAGRLGEGPGLAGEALARQLFEGASPRAPRSFSEPKPVRFQLRDEEDGPTTAVSTASGTVDAGQLLSEARSYLGTPYRFGANGDSDEAVDCSSLVQQVYSAVGIKLPRTVREQFAHGVQVPREDLRPGDLLFFRTYASFPSHVGIYVGNGRMIHASTGERRVILAKVDVPYFNKRYLGARRLGKL